MKFNIIIATCTYPELDDAISKSIKIASMYDTIVRLKVIKDSGKIDSWYVNTYNVHTKCTISKNSQTDKIKKYLDKMFSKGNVKRGC